MKTNIFTYRDYGTKKFSFIDDLFYHEDLVQFFITSFRVLLEMGSLDIVYFIFHSLDLDKQAINCLSYIASLVIW